MDSPKSARPDRADFVMGFAAGKVPATVSAATESVPPVEEKRP